MPAIVPGTSWRPHESEVFVILCFLPKHHYLHIIIIISGIFRDVTRDHISIFLELLTILAIIDDGCIT